MLGRIFNLAGVPGLVRECSYSASVADTQIYVKKSPLFTTISINGLDIYFHRLTGRIDGVGVNRCKLEKAAQSEAFPE